MIEFKAWPKIPRLFRECVLTEKIDGTNSAVGVVPLEADYLLSDEEAVGTVVTGENGSLSDAFLVYAQSRNRIITPADDNFGFAAWVTVHAVELVDALGEGLHFGEWWGSGIGRGYGLQKGEKRFSLFNVERYKDADFSELPNVGLVPELYRGPFNTHEVEYQVEKLRHTGSIAAPGFDRPEGVITFHVAANQVFKTTLEKDEKPKGSDEPG